MADGADADTHAGEEDADADRRTPVTVLTGALGAGKTTLLKYILEKPHGYRVAVIQNEFSDEMGMESPLITDAAGDTFKDIVELPNGCLCCSAKDGLISALDHLLEDRRRFDYVLVEATGVADPESICEIFWVDDELGSKVYLDGVVTLVDSRNLLSALGAGADESGSSHDAGDAADLGLEAETAKQVACADVLVLNKVDLAPEAKRARVSKHVTRMNPTAAVLESTYAQVPLGDILGIRAFDEARLATTLSQLHSLGGHVVAEADAHGEGEGDAHGHGHGHTGHAAHGHSHGHGGPDADEDCEDCKAVGSTHKVNHGIESLLLRGRPAEAVYDPSKIRAWLADVLWEGTAGGVYRCKGLFRGAEAGHCSEASPCAYAVQGVGKLFEIEEVDCTADASKFLFIGKGLERGVLEAGLRDCRQLAAGG